MYRAIRNLKAALGGMAVLCVLVAVVAAPGASASGVKKQIKQLKEQIAALQQQVNNLQTQPGPQGSQGAQGPQGEQGATGAAPPCQGNGSGDTMVSAGAVCIDRYENSIWTQANGGTRLTGVQIDNACPENGQPTGPAPCTAFFARSVPGVTPARDVTYFQAQQALANAGKRLPSVAEWQQAVSGTPDPPGVAGSEDCNTTSADAEPAGERAHCLSPVGAHHSSQPRPSSSSATVQASATARQRCTRAGAG